MAGERLKIVVVGATGTIGTAVAAALAPLGEVLKVGRTRGEERLDARSRPEIEAFYARIGPFDHLVSLVGASTPMGLLSKLRPEDFALSFDDKVRPQIELVQAGLAHVRDRGSFTLSGGFLNKEPMPGFSAITMANGAVEGFVKGAALDMPRGVRLNAVSPVFVLESLQGAGITDTSGFVTMSAADTAKAYRAAVEGPYNGVDLDPRKFVEA